MSWVQRSRVPERMGWLLGASLTPALSSGPWPPRAHVALTSTHLGQVALTPRFGWRVSYVLAGSEIHGVLVLCPLLGPKHRGSPQGAETQCSS